MAGRKCIDCYQATIGYNDNFEDPGSDVAERLYKAMKGLGTDEDTVGLILGTHSNEQLLIVKQTYKAMHGEVRQV